MSANRVLASVLRIGAVLGVLGGALFALTAYGRRADFDVARRFCQDITVGTNRQSVLDKMSAIPRAHLSFESPGEINVGFPGACHCALPVNSGAVTSGALAYCNG
jgi:hypothetical protein